MSFALLDCDLDQDPIFEVLEKREEELTQFTEHVLFSGRPLPKGVAYKSPQVAVRMDPIAKSMKGARKVSAQGEAILAHPTPQEKRCNKMVQDPSRGAMRKDLTAKSGKGTREVSAEGETLLVQPSPLHFPKQVAKGKVDSRWRFKCVPQFKSSQGALF